MLFNVYCLPLKMCVEMLPNLRFRGEKKKTAEHMKPT